MMRPVLLLGALLHFPGCVAPLPVQPFEAAQATPPPPQAAEVVRSLPATRATPVLNSFPPASKRLALHGKRIVVDAGHGGKDPGAQGLSAAPEKTLTLALAKELSGRLKARGATVTLTRPDDRFIDLDRRAAVADTTRTDLLVSLHADSASRAQASGVGAWIARSALGGSQRAAREILSSIQAAGLKVRGIQQAGFRVLVGHQRPAVLIECGFLTNAQDAKQLNSAWYRGRMAEAIAAGIERSLGR